MDKPDDIPYGYCRCGCGNRTGHLEPVTHAENCRRSAATKLTSEGAEEIRRRYSPGNAPLLAIEFGISPKTVHSVISGEVWTA